MSKGELVSKRVKVTLACSNCRKKKVKCDGIQPTCSRCASIGKDCQYSDPPKKRGPPKGFVEVIENRAHRIESLLGKDQSVKPDNKHIILSEKNIEDIPQSTHLQPVNALLCLIAGAVDTMQQNVHNDSYLYSYQWHTIEFNQ
ncbi:hypothetical protein BDB01DRAFT_786328 [Pilobolus umbonatus]|nr:hypothetical protein BDB01DRAFT_786328 [Pilobolus umbonatus]